MELSITPEVLVLTLRGVERILIALSGLASIYLGYKLVRLLPSTATEMGLEIKNGYIKARRVTPPALLLILGAWILVNSTITQIEIHTQSTKESTSSMVNEATDHTASEEKNTTTNEEANSTANVETNITANEAKNPTANTSKKHTVNAEKNSTTSVSTTSKLIRQFANDQDRKPHTIATLNTALKLIDTNSTTSKIIPFIDDLNRHRESIEEDRNALVHQIVGNEAWAVWEKYSGKNATSSSTGISDADRKTLKEVKQCIEADLTDF